MQNNEDDDSLVLKKELLRTEILDQNYDQNQFIDFCLNKKENGDDINIWTLDELKEVINEFKSKKNEENSTNSENKNIISSENQEEIKKENIEKMESMNVKKIYYIIYL
jgi:hypothetical protein